MLRRALPGSCAAGSRPGRLVDWAEIEPFVAHVPTARLQIPFRKLRRLHPAKLADLVEAASHEEGEEIIRAVGADRELEADVFEELDTEHQLEFLRARSDEEAARLLSAMAPDDAVDLLTELDQERRLPILTRLPPATQAKLRTPSQLSPRDGRGAHEPRLHFRPGQRHGGARPSRPSRLPRPRRRPPAWSSSWATTAPCRARPCWSTCCGPTRRQRGRGHQAGPRHPFP